MYRLIKRVTKPTTRKRLKHPCPLCETAIVQDDLHVKSTHVDPVTNQLITRLTHAECQAEYDRLTESESTLGKIVPALVSGLWADKELSPRWRAWLAKRDTA